MCRVDQCRLVGDAVEFGEQAFLKVEQACRLCIILTRSEFELGGAFGQFAAVGAVGEAFLEGVFAVFIGCGEDV